MGIKLASADIPLYCDVELRSVDLASLASVRAFTDGVLADHDHLDVVIANAGIMACPQGTTSDGFETQFGTNHLGHFVLVNRLVPLMSRGGRIVTLSSTGHRLSDVDLDDPNFEHTPYDAWMSYGRAKTANAHTTSLEAVHIMQHPEHGGHTHRQLQRRHSLHRQVLRDLDHVPGVVNHVLRVAPPAVMSGVTPGTHAVTRLEVRDTRAHSL